MTPAQETREAEQTIRIGLAVDYCRIASKVSDLPTAHAIALAALDVLSLPISELDPDTAAAFDGITAASPVEGGGDPLPWLLRILVAAGGVLDCSDYPHDPLRLFYDDGKERGEDTFNRAIRLGLTRTTHDSDTDISTVHITDAGRAFVSTFPPQATNSEVERLREAIKRARGLLLYPLREHLDDHCNLNTTGTLAVADVLLEVEGDLIKPVQDQQGEKSQPETRNVQKLPARDLTDAELVTEMARVEKLWDSLHEPDEDGEEFEGHGGSPGEWMVERMDEIATEQARRAALVQPAVAP